jgi:hypothetical protein
MAITTLDGVVAGMRPAMPIAKAVTATLVAGRPASLWSLAGSPGATPYAGKDTLATFEVYKTQAAFNNGRHPKFANTVPFDYVPGGGNINTQALEALKLEFPGLVDA